MGAVAPDGLDPAGGPWIGEAGSFRTLPSLVVT
jgi:hypothetical protein